MFTNVITQSVDTQIRSVISELVPKYDRNSNGRLSPSELQGFLNEAMHVLGWEIEVTQEDARQTLTIFDKNWDGELSYEQIYSTLRCILSKQLTGQYYFQSQDRAALLKVQQLVKAINESKLTAGSETQARKLQAASQRCEVLSDCDPTILDDVPSPVPLGDEVSKQQPVVCHPQPLPLQATAQTIIHRTNSKYIGGFDSQIKLTTCSQQSIDESKISLSYSQVHSIASPTIVSTTLTSQHTPPTQVSVPVEQIDDLLSSKLDKLHLGGQPAKETAAVCPPPETFKKGRVFPWAKSDQVSGWEGVQINTVADLKLKRLVDDLFNKYDKDSSGTLSITQLVPAFQSISQQMKIQQSQHKRAKDLLAMYDRNGDGCMQRYEMYNCIRSFIKE